MKAKTYNRITSIGSKAASFGWSGEVSSEVVDSQRITILSLIRLDETIGLEWVEDEFSLGKHYIFDKLTELKELGDARRFLYGYPDIADLFKTFPKISRPYLTKNYVRLPFALDSDNEDIIASIIDCKVFWYERNSGKIRVDVVLPPKGAKAKILRIQDIGHRKLLHFMGAKNGQCSMMLDQILKVS